MSDKIRNFVSDFESKTNPESAVKYINKDDSIKILFKQKDATDEEIVIRKFPNDINSIMNKSVILYGPSGSGKTRIIRDFMHTTKLCYPLVFAFVPTNAQKHDYDSLIPKPLVFESFDLKNIKEIYTRQKSTTEVYNNANNLKILNSLFLRIATPKDKIFHKKLLFFKDHAITKSEQKNQSLADKKSKYDEIEEIFKNKLIHFYKQVINPNVRKLQAMDLSEKEKYALTFRNLNPRILILFDDAFTEVMDLIRKGKKQKDETIKNFFYKGRWANITHWYGFQDEKGLDSEIRKNVFINVFTDKQVAMSYFTRPANSFTCLEKKKAEAVINAVFSEENIPQHYKLVYSRSDKNKFYYIIANEYVDNDIQMCSKSVRDFCKKIGKVEDNFDTNNPFFAAFKNQID